MMHVNIQKVAPLVLMLGMLLLVCLQPAAIGAPQAAALRVLAIEIDGKQAERAEGVALTASGESTPRKTAMKTGEAIAQGTDIVVPSRTVLVLETANGNQIRLQPGSGYRTGSVSGQGETHTMLFGKAFFRVKHALDFFNVNYESFLAIVRGTEFSVDVEPKKEISFSLDKGKLLVQRDVKVRILEGNKVADMKASEVLQQGGKTTVSYPLDIEEYLKEFKTFRDAEEYYKQKLAAAEKSGKYEEQQIALNAMGNILVVLGRQKDALQYYHTALKKSEFFGDKIWESYLLNNLGQCYCWLGQFNKAIDIHNKALETQAVLLNQSHVDIAACYIGLGTCHMLLKQNEIAINYFNKALDMLLKLFPKAPNEYIAGCHQNLGTLYYYSYQPEKAEKHLKKALDIRDALYHNQPHYDMATAYCNIGGVYHQKGQIKLAMDSYNKSLDMMTNLYPDQKHPYFAVLYYNIYLIYEQLGDHEKAQEYINKIETLEKELSITSIHEPESVSEQNQKFNTSTVLVAPKFVFSKSTSIAKSKNSNNEAGGVPDSLTLASINNEDIKISHLVIKYGKKYNFWLDMKNHSDHDIKIGGFTFSMVEEWDYNGSKEFPKYKYTDWIKEKKGILKPGESGKIIELDGVYPVIYYPKISRYDNLRLMYKTKLLKKKDDEWVFDRYTVDYVLYKVVRE